MQGMPGMFGSPTNPAHAQAMAMLGAEQQQRQVVEAMAAMGMLPPGATPHPHALQQMQQEQMEQAALMNMMNAAGVPFGRPPFPGPMPGVPGGEMMHPFGRPPTLYEEQQQMMVAHAQAQVGFRHPLARACGQRMLFLQQAAAERQMQAENIHRFFQMGAPGPHPDMFR